MPWVVCGAVRRSVTPGLQRGEAVDRAVVELAGVELTGAANELAYKQKAMRANAGGGFFAILI